MTDTTHEAPDLLPCPFCGCGMIQNKLRMARCGTEGCYMHNFVIDLDSPQSVAAWNTRSDDLVQAAVAAEREACARLAEAHKPASSLTTGGGPNGYWRGVEENAFSIAAAIRARTEGEE